MQITEYIKDLLLFNEKLTLPGLGTFEFVKEPAKISGNRINPPSTSIIINQEIKNDDNKLAESIASGEEMDLETANRNVYEYVGEIYAVLNKGEKYIFRGLGELSRDKNDDLKFEKDPLFIIDFDSFGLESFELEIEENNQADEGSVAGNPDEEMVPDQKEPEYFSESFIPESPVEDQKTEQLTAEEAQIIPEVPFEVSNPSSEFISWENSGEINSLNSEFIAGSIPVTQSAEDMISSDEPYPSSEFITWENRDDGSELNSEFTASAGSTETSQITAAEIQAISIPDGNTAEKELIVQNSQSVEETLIENSPKEEAFIPKPEPEPVIKRIQETPSSTFSSHNRKEPGKKNSGLPWILTGIGAIILAFVFLQFTDFFDNTPLKILNRKKEIIAPVRDVKAEKIEEVDPLGNKAYKEYHIIAGSFTDTVNARELSMELTKQGYTTIILNQGTNIYRVSVSYFTNKSEGIERLKQFRAQTKNNAAWLLGLE